MTHTITLTDSQVKALSALLTNVYGTNFDGELKNKTLAPLDEQLTNIVDNNFSVKYAK